MTHIFYTLISGLIKASICLLYLRLFPNIRNIILCTIVFITAMTVAIILATIFQCSPIDAVYNEDKYEHYTCFPSIPFWYATAALSLVTDILILVLPLKTLLGMYQQRPFFKLEANERQVFRLQPVKDLSFLPCYLWDFCAC